jgi:hypothetical protein
VSEILDEAEDPLLDEAGDPLLTEAGTGPSLVLVKVSPSAVMAGAGTPLGPQSMAIGNAGGNLLVAFAAWNSSEDASSTAVIPASSVCDSQGNWWRLAGDSGNTCPGARVAAWFSQSALAVPDTGWWSAALQGIVNAALWGVAEFSGAPAGYEPVVDFAVPFSSTAGGTAVTIGAFTTQADWCFAVAACGNSAASASASPPGWTTLASGSQAGGPAAGDTAGITAVCAWSTQAAGSSLSPGWTFTSPGQRAGILVGISQASSAPVAQNGDYPVVRAEAAFGALAGDPSQAVADSAWTDLTPRTLTKAGTAGISAGRGRPYEQAEPEAGVLSVLMSNVDGAFSPSWPGSPYYSSALNSNMSFQYTTAPWYGSNGASLFLSGDFTFASAPGASAECSLLLEPDGVTADPAILWDEPVPVAQGSAYSASCWFCCPAGWSPGAYASVDWYDASGTFISGAIGSYFPLPAGAWTQAVYDAAPPAGAAFAAFAFIVHGTPPDTTVFYLAEAALSAGTLQTGLVRLGTPVRVSAYWEGRRYPVGYGYVERWPQDWPDMPQWGFSPMVATDQVGAAASATVPSAVQGEILADGPYACFPFDDQYSTSTNTADGTVTAPAPDCDGLIAVNTSRVNQQAATYADGSQPVTTGQSLSFLGDSGTGMGVSTYGSVDTSRARGAGAVYGPDYGLPVISSTEGISAEFWFTMPEVASLGEEQLFPLLQLYGPPGIGSLSAADSAPGWLMAAGVQLPAVSGDPALFVQTAAQASRVILSSGALSSGGLNHVVLTTDAGSPSLLNAYLNGVNLSPDLETVNNTGQVTAVTFGEAGWAWSGAWTLWNYALAYGTVYSYALNGLRVYGHYLSGSTGFSGDTVAQRFGRYLAWADAGLNPGGPGSITDAMLLSSAYGSDGSSLASALNSDAASSGASWHASAGGNLVILPRPAIYGQPAAVTFGDNPAYGEIPYQADLGFDYDNTYLKNITQATLDQGPNTSVSPVIKDIASVSEYSARGPLSLTVSGASAQDAYDAASWNLSKYSQPQMRVRQVTVDAASYPAAFTAVLQTDIADVAAVIRRPVGGPAYYLPVITQRVQHSIGPGVWKTTYQLSPYVQEAAVLQADAPGSDVLGAGTVLAW